MQGGWRYGAGRPRVHPDEHSYRSVDVRKLDRAGSLNKDVFGWAWWNDEGEKVACISGIVSPDAVRFDFRQTYREQTRDLSVRVCFDWTAPNYGGRRRWFRCPRCDRRCTRLWIVIGGMGCRTCFKFSYRSQSDDSSARLSRRAEKIEARLANGMKRPKGMHRVTHKRLTAEYWRLDETLDSLIWDRVERIVGWR